MDLPTWRQANVAFPHWEHAENVALAHLAPLLHAAEDKGALTAWFIVRKRPCWRVRYRLPAAESPDPISRGLDELAADGHTTDWTHVVYEPEVHAFGGTGAMGCAHRFFHRDSRAMTSHLQAGARPHRREISLMLCSLLLRSAGLDWYEQGDVWARVGDHRPPPPAPNQDNCGRLLTDVHRLISVSGEDLMRPGTSLAHVAAWAGAYTNAGQELARLAHSGNLHRGLRDVLAHHVLFAWNRIGLPHDTQAALAAASRTAVFGPSPAHERSPADHGTPT
ncbi:thiopeptide-type bacteriocin biosynthesis protein [Streptomyces sp. NPDC058739]|uniref:thiopeptide-type bacteriocin biosynthesis protein n=1 Tax=Streptomyces sp. NPDC058739 TaxID=3346618 RepID=UPI0036CCA3DB